HALVDLLGGLHEERHALLQGDHGERGGDSGAVGDDRTVGARGDLPRPGLVAVRDGVRDASTAGDGEELGAEADEATRRHDELHAHPTGAVVAHAFHAPLAGGEQLRDGAEVFLRRIHGEVFEWLVHLAVDLLDDHLRLADGELEALAAHLLDEDGEGEFTTTLHLPGIRAPDVDELDRDVTDELAVEAVL